MIVAFHVPVDVAISFAAIAIGLLALILSRFVSGQQVAICKKCGYNVRGSVNWFCPECGADYRVVGIKIKMSTKNRMQLGAIVFAAIPFAIITAKACTIIKGF